MRLKILIFLDHPIIVRHFVDSGAFSELVASHDVRFVVPPADHKRIAGANLSAIPSETLVRLAECKQRNEAWMRLFQIDAFRNRGSSQARALSDHQRAAIGKKAAWLYSVLGLPGVWSVYRRYLALKIRGTQNRPLEALMDREKPDIVLHPTVLAGAYINDLIATCRARNTPVVGIMNSWDNPSTKRAVVGHFDWLLVWGPQTRDHAVRYLGMKPDSVVRFGAAQLDLYRTEPRVRREATRAFYGIAQDARMLLYAGSSKGSDEFQHLDLLETAIEKGELTNITVVYRPHPWGNCGKDGGRIAARSWKHVRFDASMAAYIEAARGGPQPITTPDYRNTQDILAAADMLISPVSTILLEASLNGIPNICLIDDIDESNWFFEVNTRLEHLREYFATPEFLVAKSVSQMTARVGQAAALLDDSESLQRIKKASQFFVDAFDAPYPTRLKHFVEDLFVPEMPHRGKHYLISSANDPVGRAAPV
jgi:hypothetical protein